MPYYILTAKFGGPQIYQEYCYDEVVEVKDRIAITQKPASAEQLQRMDGFTLLATVDTEEDIEKFLHPEPDKEIMGHLVGPKTPVDSGPSIPKMAVRGRPKKELSTSLSTGDLKIPLGPSVPWFDNEVEFTPKVK